MDEMTATQNVDTQDVDTQDVDTQDVDTQDDFFEMPAADEAAEFDDEDVYFDMDAAADEKMDEQARLEAEALKASDDFAAKFAEDWTLEPPKAADEVEPIISKFLAKKARRRA